MKKRNFDEKQDYRAYLYRLLTSRVYTEYEVAEKLVQKGADREEARKLAEEFRELGFIDDEAYARLFADSHDNWGSARIRYELRRRKVAEDKISLALGDTDEIEKAKPLVENWAASGLEWQKIASRLMRRGFSSRTIGALKQDEEDEGSYW